MTLDEIAGIAREWRSAEREWLAQEEPVRVGQLGFGARKETELHRDAKLNDLRAAVDTYDAEQA
jgi:hypothetical protein